VHTEIAVSGIHQVLEIAERQRFIRREGADDTETHPLVDDLSLAVVRRDAGALSESQSADRLHLS